MVIKSFTVGVKHHVNLGNYESMEVTMDVDDLNFKNAISEAQMALQTLQDRTYEAQKKPTWFANIASKKAKTA